MTKAEHIIIYTERYEALLAAGAIKDSVGGYNRMTTEDRFRVYCCQEVWSRIRFAETDRLLHFTKAVFATSDENLSLDDPVMAKAFGRYKAAPMAHSSSHNLSLGRDRSNDCARKSHRDEPCGCGKVIDSDKHTGCMACMRIRWAKKRAENRAKKLN